VIRDLDHLPGLDRRSAQPLLAFSSSLLQNMRMNAVRIDKWLWAARFFKTRSLAARACELGRILLGTQPCKPAREIHAGDHLQITNESGEFQIEVLGVSEVRGPAPVAQALYRESPESIEHRKLAAAERKAVQEWEILPQCRPDKRDRRKIIKFRGR
jgi:ribosome-associated heat shock protein Hsp15